MPRGCPSPVPLPLGLPWGSRPALPLGLPSRNPLYCTQADQLQGCKRLAFVAAQLASILGEDVDDECAFFCHLDEEGQ